MAFWRWFSFSQGGISDMLVPWRVKPFSSLHSSRVSDLSPWTTWHCTHLWRARGSSVPAAPRIRPLSWSKYLVLSSDLSKTQHPRMGLENLWPNQKCGNPLANWIPRTGSLNENHPWKHPISSSTTNGRSANSTPKTCVTSKLFISKGRPFVTLPHKSSSSLFHWFLLHTTFEN